MNQEALRNSEVFHGGANIAELEKLGLDIESVVDFSSNIHPVEHPESIKKAILESSLSRYPDRDGTELRNALGEFHHVPATNILLGNGCAELIHLVARTFVRRGTRNLIVEPTFSEYRRAAELNGGNTLIVKSSEFSQFSIPTAEIEEIVDALSPKLVWICNPNNPTGTWLSSEYLVQWIQRYPDTVFIVDESYIDFVPGVQSLANEVRSNLIVLRSLTKFYALAGLRIGYLIATPAMIQQIQSFRVPWSVNSIALSVGCASLKQRDYFRTSSQWLEPERNRMQKAISDMGLQVFSSAANYFLVAVPNGEHVRELLLKRGLLVRDCQSFGLPNMIRIAVQRPEENQRLIDSLTELQIAATKRSS